MADEIDTTDIRYFTTNKERTEILLDGKVLFSGLIEADALVQLFNETLVKYGRLRMNLEIVTGLRKIFEKDEEEGGETEGPEQ